jgi:hypothetical protein
VSDELQLMGLLGEISGKLNRFADRRQTTRFSDRSREYRRTSRGSF